MHESVFNLWILICLQLLLQQRITYIIANFFIFLNYMSFPKISQISVLATWRKQQYRTKYVSVKMGETHSEMHQLRWNSIAGVTLHDAGLRENPDIKSVTENHSSTYLRSGKDLSSPILPNCHTQHRLSGLRKKSSRSVHCQLFFQWVQVLKKKMQNISPSNKHLLNYCNKGAVL